ncbi:MAG: ADP-ribosylation factor-like protein [Candidatus Hodarchaeales archaeon]
MQDYPRKRIPIVIVGLEFAGKTSFVLRLQTGEFVNTLPTSGLDTEILEIQGTFFQLFDLGGHERFRHMFWKEYVKLSQGIVFMIDASDLEKLDDAVEWLWKCLEWNLEAPLVILANKADLTHIELPKLIDKVNLRKLPRQSPTRSFQIFEISVKTGMNIDRALNWFSQKIAVSLSKKYIKLEGIYLFLRTGVPIVSHLFMDQPEEAMDNDIVPGFLNAINEFASGVMGGSEGLSSLTTEKHSIVMVKHETLLCAIITDLESDLSVARMVAESVVMHLEKAYPNQLLKYQSKGKFLFPENFLVDYLQQEFNENVVIST